MHREERGDRFSFASGLALLVAVAMGALVACRSANKPVTPAQAAIIAVDPNQFEGDTKQAYIVARDHPELLAQLDCYCGCEQHEGHKNLLTCFRTRHGAGCDICIGEAVAAGKLADGGMPVEQIRTALHQQFAHDS